MAIFFEKKERHVIPNWRNFENTAQLGELSFSKSIELNTSFKPNIDDLLEDWKYSKSIGVAADLLGVAITCNQQDNPIVREISDFVLSQKNTTPALIDAANLIKAKENGNGYSKFEINSNETFLYKENLKVLFQKINFFKKKLIDNPYNPIAWVELSRLYTINGQDTKAEVAMRNALYLAPENRFVLRNMARFFAHIGDFEFAHDNIRKSLLVNYDPWLMATEIALADLRGRGSKFAKMGMQLVHSNSLHPFNISELSSSIATLEMKNSSSKSSKKFFEKSLIFPNDNALAQAEWASQEDLSLLSIGPIKFCARNSFEALARNEAGHKKWNEAIEYSKKWFLDLPFSKSSILFGSNIASVNLKDQKLAVDVARLGLISHPNDPQLLNNIAYSLCLDNQLVEAEKTLNQVKKDEYDYGEINLICLTATRGLLYFRKGEIEKGRKLYLSALEMTKGINDHYYNSLAFVNYVREEILVNEIDLSIFIPKLEEIKKCYDGKDISDMADEVIKSYKK